MVNADGVWRFMVKVEDRDESQTKDAPSGKVQIRTRKYAQFDRRDTFR